VTNGGEQQGAKRPVVVHSRRGDAAASERRGVGNGRGASEYPCPHRLALWLSGSLALWLSSSLALWLSGSLALWLSCHAVRSVEMHDHQRAPSPIVIG